MFVTDVEGDFTFHPIAEEAPRYAALPAGVYKVGQTRNGLFFRPMTIDTDGLIDLKTTVAKEVRAEIKSFFDHATRARLRASEVKNRRGIILYGPPGTGKTSIVRSLFPYIIERGAVILVDPNPDMLEHHTLPAIHFADKCRDVVLFFDEFDKNACYSESELKQLLDGLASPDNILTIGCTNYLNRVPETLWKRPSRFSLVREMPAPDSAVRTAYLRKKFPVIPADVAFDLANIVLDKPLDYVQEVCTLYLRGMDVDEIRDRITGIKPSVLVMDDDDDSSSDD